jgi:hypothetical protein
MSMGWLRCLLGLGLGLAVTAGSAIAEDYDDPALGATPCVVLNSYASHAAASGGAETFRAEAGIENVCGRSVEVSFCFPLVEAVGDVERQCVTSTLRPWSKARVHVEELPGRIIGVDYHWRYLLPEG